MSKIYQYMLGGLLVIMQACLLAHTSYGKVLHDKQGEVITTLSPMLKKAMPAVVNVFAEGKTLSIPKMDEDTDHNDEDQDPNTPPGAPQERKFRSAGSGVIVDGEKGYVITNSHVVKKANRIIVTLSNGHRFKAKLIGEDPASDVAILQIDAKHLYALPFADSDKLNVGDFVAAIGNPFGLDQSVTSGIVSALQRNNLGIEGYEDFIQTDASINPGNSGGALVNLRGELIGINTAIIGPNGGNVGIGLAIPSNMAKSVMTQIIKYGKVQRGLLGILVQPLTPELAKAFGNSKLQGAVITQISPESPADIAGLEVGDIILAVNGKWVKNGGQVRNIIGLQRMGSKISLDVLRHGKKHHFTAETLDPKRYVNSTHKANPFLYGMAVTNFEEQLPGQGYVRGVRVIAVDENSPTWQAGVRPGDVVVSANQKEITDIQALNSLVKTNPPQLLVNVLRGRGALFLVIKPS